MNKYFYLFILISILIIQGCTTSHLWKSSIRSEKDESTIEKSHVYFDIKNSNYYFYYNVNSEIQPESISAFLNDIEEGIFKLENRLSPFETNEFNHIFYPFKRKIEDISIIITDSKHFSGISNRQYHMQFIYYDPKFTIEFLSKSELDLLLKGNKEIVEEEKIAEKKYLDSIARKVRRDILLEAEKKWSENFDSQDLKMYGRNPFKYTIHWIKANGQLSKKLISGESYKGGLFIFRKNKYNVAGVKAIVKNHFNKRGTSFSKTEKLYTMNCLEKFERDNYYTNFIKYPSQLKIKVNNTRKIYKYPVSTRVLLSPFTAVVDVVTSPIYLVGYLIMEKMGPR